MHQNGVESRQQFNGAVRTSLVTTPYDGVQCRATLPENLLHRDGHTLAHTWMWTKQII